MRSIPDEFKPYIPLIQACPLTAADEGQIGYLTIDERTVTNHEPQRRGGLHAESPGLLHVAPGGGGDFTAPPNPGALTFFWGGGHYCSNGERCVYEGGVYMASTVTSSCRVWNAKVARAAMGELGDLEHVRPLLGPGTCLKENELVWMTDTTPHESLPLVAGTTRQVVQFPLSSHTLTIIRLFCLLACSSSPTVPCGSTFGLLPRRSQPGMPTTPRPTRSVSCRRSMLWCCTAASSPMSGRRSCACRRRRQPRTRAAIRSLTC